MVQLWGLVKQPRFEKYLGIATLKFSLVLFSRWFRGKITVR